MSDRYKDSGAASAQELYTRDMSRVLSESSEASTEFALETARELLAEFQGDLRFAEPIFTLYESVAPIEFSQSNQIIDLVTSWVANNTSLQQLGRALALRRLLVSAGDISKLDAALGTVIAKYQASDEAFLQQVIEVGSRDLLLSFFKQIFSNELSQLEISMQLEDLFSGIGWVYQGKIQAKKALGILGSVGVEEVLDFPKLNLLRKSGISLKPVGLRSENPLFRDRR